MILNFKNWNRLNEQTNEVEPKPTATNATGARYSIDPKSQQAALKGTGAYREHPPYKGKIVKDANGRITSYTTHDGTFVQVTNPTESKKVEAIMKRDKDLWQLQKDKVDARNTAAKEAKYSDEE